MLQIIHITKSIPLFSQERRIRARGKTTFCTKTNSNVKRVRMSCIYYNFQSFDYQTLRDDKLTTVNFDHGYVCGNNNP
jgi:hypothetical protein